jgi:hypothetical protein
VRADRGILRRTTQCEQCCKQCAPQVPLLQVVPIMQAPGQPTHEPPLGTVMGMHVAASEDKSMCSVH